MNSGDIILPLLMFISFKEQMFADRFLCFLYWADTGHAHFWHKKKKKKKKGVDNKLRADNYIQRNCVLKLRKDI
jgi:hypothetical protein